MALGLLRKTDAQQCALADQGAQKSASPLRLTLAAIAEQGPRGFYQGPVAERLVKAIGDAGGIMTLDDLKSYQALTRAPLRGSHRDKQKHQQASRPIHHGTILALGPRNFKCGACFSG